MSDPIPPKGYVLDEPDSTKLDLGSLRVPTGYALDDTAAARLFLENMQMNPSKKKEPEIMQGPDQLRTIRPDTTLTDTMKPVYETVLQFEVGDDPNSRANRHNNPGAHVWTPELADKYGAKRGDPFEDSSGSTYYTAKYDSMAQGTKASKFIIDRIWDQTDGNPLDFAAKYTGEAPDSQIVANYAQEIQSKIDNVGTIDTPGLIVEPKDSGFSKKMTVSGREGRFNFNIPPKEQRTTEGGHTNWYRFEAEDGSNWNHRIEEDKQGGRWEEDPLADQEYLEWQKDPQGIYDHWEHDSNLTAYIVESAESGVPWSEFKEGLKGFNTYRQESGDLIPDDVPPDPRINSVLNGPQESLGDILSKDYSKESYDFDDKIPLFLRLGWNESITGAARKMITGEEAYDLSEEDPNALEGIAATIFGFMMPLDALTFGVGGKIGAKLYNWGLNKTVGILSKFGISRKAAVKLATAGSQKFVARLGGAGVGLGSYQGIHNAMTQKAEGKEVDWWEVSKAGLHGFFLGSVAAMGGTLGGLITKKLFGKGLSTLGNRFFGEQFGTKAAKAIGDLGGEVVSFGTLAGAIEGRMPTWDDYLGAAGVIMGMRGVNLGKAGFRKFSKEMENRALSMKNLVEAKNHSFRQAMDRSGTSYIEWAADRVVEKTLGVDLRGKSGVREAIEGKDVTDQIRKPKLIKTKEGVFSEKPKTPAEIEQGKPAKPPKPTKIKTVRGPGEKGEDVLARGVRRGITDPGTEGIGRYLLKSNPKLAKKIFLEISDRTVEITDEYIRKNHNMTPEEFFKAEGKRPGRYMSVGQTKNFVKNGIEKTALKLYKGHDADTIVEEFYGAHWRNLNKKSQKMFERFHNKSRDTRSSQEHYEQDGRDFFFSEKMHQKAGMGIRSIFQNARGTLRDLIGRIRKIRGAKVPKEVQKLWKSAVKVEKQPTSTSRQKPRGRAAPSKGIPDKGRVPEQISIFKDATHQLRRTSKNVSKNRYKDETKIFEVSIHPKELADIKDKNSKVKINNLKDAETANTNKERVKDWKKIHSTAKDIPPAKMRKAPIKVGKLVGVEVLMLTKGCQRAETTVERVQNGVLPKETRTEACFGGDCWVNKQFNSKFGAFENMEVRDLEIASEASISKLLGNPKMIDKLNKALFIRQGFAGDDSHLFSTGRAVHYLKEAKANGLIPKTIFISASYAPVTSKQYKAMAEYKDKFEIHFSNSGWFHKNEIMIRLNEFQKAKAAGLNVSIRMITNKDGISGITMDNQRFIAKELEKMGVKQAEVLETPFHDDSIANKELRRSNPTGDYKYICCEFGKCGPCKYKCMTTVDKDASIQVTHQLRDMDPEAKVGKERGQVDPYGTDVSAIRQASVPASDAEFVEAKPSVEVKVSRKKPLSQQEIVQFVRKAFNAPVFGKSTVKMGKVQGYFKPFQRYIRLREEYNTYVLSHEIAHLIDQDVWKGDKQRFKPWQDELSVLDYNPNKGRTSEGFAEFMRHYVTTGRAEFLAPKFYKYFTTTFAKENPKLWKNIEKFRDMMSEYHNQGAYNRILSQIDFSGEGPKRPLGTRIRDYYQLLRHRFYSDVTYIDRVLRQSGVKKKIRKGKWESTLPSTKDPEALFVAKKGKASGMARQWVFEGTTDFVGRENGESLNAILKDVVKLEGVLDPLNPGKTVKGTKLMQAFIGYTFSRRALSRPDIETGAHLSDAEYIFKLMDTKGFRSASDRLNGWMDRVLDYMIDAGALPAEGKAAMKALNPFYLPLKRLMTDPFITNPKGGGGSGSGTYLPTSGIKRLRGSGRKVVNPLESMVGIAENLISVADKTRLVRAIADLEHTQGLGMIIRRIPAPTKVTNVNTQRILDSLGEQMMGRLDKMGDKDKMRMLMNTTKELAKEMAPDYLQYFSQSDRYVGSGNVIVLWRNTAVEVKTSEGIKRKMEMRPHFYEIDDGVYRVLQGIDRVQMGPVISAISHVTRGIKFGAVGFHLAFSYITNPVRDIPTYLLFSKAKLPNPAAPMVALAADLGLGSQKYKQASRTFRGMGGELATIMGRDRARSKKGYKELLARSKGWKGKTVHSVLHPVDALRTLFQLPELAPRIAEFKTRLEHYEKKYGKDSDDARLAAFNDAQDVTINFSRMGVWGSILNQLIPFYNPDVQGGSKILRSFQERPLATMLRGVSAITFPTFMAYWMNKDKEWFKNIPAPMKYSHIYIDLADIPWADSKEVIVLPLPHEPGVIFGGLPMAMWDELYQGKDKAFMEAAQLMFNQVNPIPNPLNVSGVNVLYQMFANRNWYGAPIESLGDQFKEAPDRYHDYTTEVAKAASQWSYDALQYTGQWLPGAGELANQMSPKKIENFMGGLTGGLATRMMRLMDLALKDDPIKSKADLPTVGRLFHRKRLGVTVDYKRMRQLQRKRGSKNMTASERNELKRLEKRARRR